MAGKCGLRGPLAAKVKPVNLDWRPEKLDSVATRVARADELAGEPGLIAGRVRLRDAMSVLADRRPVFHSEADFQFALAQAIASIDPKVEIRLEKPVTTQAGTVYLDLHCSYGDARTAIELKYFTRRWTDNVRGELFDLKHHSARDLARRYFVNDVKRLEAFAADTGGNGLAVMLTNDSALWTLSNRRGTRDAEFHIHEGQTLEGHLAWGLEDNRLYSVDLHGTYDLVWSDYSRRSGDFELRYLLLEAEASK